MMTPIEQIRELEAKKNIDWKWRAFAMITSLLGLVGIFVGVGSLTWSIISIALFIPNWIQMGYIWIINIKINDILKAEVRKDMEKDYGDDYG